MITIYENGEPVLELTLAEYLAWAEIPESLQ